MYGFRPLLAGLLLSVAIGTLAWCVVLALSQVLTAWLASGCSLEVILSGAQPVLIEPVVFVRFGQRRHAVCSSSLLRARATCPAGQRSVQWVIRERRCPAGTY
jgi:hypothetical protein